MSTVKELFNLIERKANTENEKTKQLENVEKLAKKVIKAQNTLNVFDDHHFDVKTPLEAAIRNGSVAIFQLLIKLGADPFLKPKSDRPSAMDTLSGAYFSRWSRNDDNAALFKWVRENNHSPLFNWARLNADMSLRGEFIRAGLITTSQYDNVFPIHVAIDSGRLDLVQRVVQEAGGIQHAGHINRMSLLHSGINAVLKGIKDAPKVLDFLLSQGANTQTTSIASLSAIVDVLHASLSVEKTSEEAIFEIVKLLVKNGATLSDYNSNSGYNLLMIAVTHGYEHIFNYLLNNSDTNHLNHHAHYEPNYLIFQLFSDHSSNELFNSFYVKSEQLKILELLPKLKEKGLKFDQTKDSFVYSNSYDSHSQIGLDKVNVSNMSILHFYVARLAVLREDPLLKIDGHLEIIQTLIANGANPHAKATFIQTHNVMDNGVSKTIETRTELTACEYARKVANKIIAPHGHDHDGVAYSIKSYPDENEFLRRTNYGSREIQTLKHRKFHQFRNLERVLSGKKPLIYSGLPEVEKLTKLPLIQEGAVVTPLPADFDPSHYEVKLNVARKRQLRSDWQAFKKSIVDHVKEAGSLQEFLERVEQFKKPLQLHFDVNTNANGDVINYGSTLYRFFHYFNPYKFPGSWETVRAFGQDLYGIDINTQYVVNDEYQP